MEYRTVDIIIPTYKPGIKFDELIHMLLLQTYPIQKIIVINTKTRKFPWETTGLDSKIVVKEIDKEEFDHGATRNMAVSLSTADFVVCMTQDAVPKGKELIEQLVRSFTDEKVGCVYARQLPDKHCDVIEEYTRQFNYPSASCIKDMDSLEKLGIKTFFCSNVCAAYRRSYYDVVGGFEKRAIFNEDMIMAGKMLKSGYKCVYAAYAEVVHSHNYSCIEQFKRNFDVAVSQADHPEIFQHVKSESEGIRLIKNTSKYLISIKKPWLICKLLVNSGFKYMGFLLGKNYKKLPKSLVIKCSSNPRYWT